MNANLNTNQVKVIPGSSAVAVTSNISIGKSYQEVQNRLNNFSLSDKLNIKLSGTTGTVTIPVLDSQGRPTGQTTTVTVGSNQGSAATTTSFRITGTVGINSGVLGVAGNSQNLQSSTMTGAENCYIIKNQKAMPLTGCTGTISVGGGDDCITPSSPVQASFIIDKNGYTRFGISSLSELTTKDASTRVQLNVGSHPGFMRIKVTLNANPNAADTGRMTHVFNQVQWMMSQVYPQVGNAPEWAPVKQILNNIYTYIANPTNGETTLKNAIDAVNDTTYKKSDILRAFNDAVAEYPAKTGAGSECWRPTTLEGMLMVLPKTTGPDSDSVQPSFTIPQPGAVVPPTDSAVNTGANPAVPTQSMPNVPNAADVQNIKVKTPAAGR